MPEKKYKLPKVEEHKGFYTPYRPKHSGLYYDPGQNATEFETLKVRYEFDKDGNVREIFTKYYDD